MKKIFLLICIIFFLAACEKKQVNNVTQPITSIRKDQYMENVASEDLSLLAIKYGLEKKILIDIICEYEEKTMGFCLSKGHLFPEDEIEPDLLDIPSAIEQVSNKYQIKKEILAEILIDKKMLEAGNHE